MKIKVFKNALLQFAKCLLAVASIVVASQAVAVMPKEYTVNVAPPVKVSDPSAACGIWVRNYWDVTYGANTYIDYRFIGFKRYTTKLGYVIDFDSKDSLSVWCVGTRRVCVKGDANGNCSEYRIESTEDTRTVATGYCPGGTLFSEVAQQCVCPAGQDWEASVSACRKVGDLNKDDVKLDVCRGNPVYPLTGAKSKSVHLTSFAGVPVNLEYSTRKALNESGNFEPGQVLPAPAGAGPLWTLSLQKLLFPQNPSPQIYVGEDKWDFFKPAIDGVERAETRGANLEKINSPSGWVVLDKRAGTQYEFSTAVSGGTSLVAPLVRLQRIDGYRVALQQVIPYTANNWRSVPMLKVVTDALGRSMTFEYEVPPYYGPMPRLKTITHAQGTISLSYNADGMLAAITWPDGSAQSFLYEAGQVDKPWLLTGIRDENQVLTSSYSYDSAGRAVSTQGGAGANRFAVKGWDAPPTPTFNRWYDAGAGVIWRQSSWSAPGNVAVETPNGSTSQIQTKMVNGMPRVTSQSQPAGSGCAASVKRQDYDANGNTAWSEDFKGYRTCFAHDLSRNLETDRVEGLAVSTACSGLLAAGAALPANARRISTQWHPVWHLETKLAEPRRLTTKVYNGQPDPFSGGATARCAPASGTLPDGSPIVVLCKQVEQATTDTNGALGFSAALDTSVPMRTQQWTYNEYGQVLTAKDPLGNTTTNGYYADTTADYTRGDLATVTNALNQVVARYTKYHPAGQWLEMLDANGIATTRTFDLRQRLKTSTTAGRTTSYDYWPTGLLKSVALPDATAVQYGYDDAHRLTSVSDQLGNKITYTLDNSGNRIGETVTDPTGKLAKTLTRVPDALNRIQQISGRE